MFERAQRLEVPKALELIIWIDASKSTRERLSSKPEDYLCLCMSVGYSIDSTRDTLVLVQERNEFEQYDFLTIPRNQVIRRIFYTEGVELPDIYFPKKKII